MQVLGTTVNTPALLMLHGSSVGRMQGLVTSVAERYVYGSYVYSGGGAVQVKAYCKKGLLSTVLHPSIHSLKPLLLYTLSFDALSLHLLRIGRFQL